MADKKPIGRILITNDDGFSATGLAILEEIAQKIGREVWVFAPDGNCSGAGRSMTLKREITVTNQGDKRFSCDGTPTDCVILALNHFMQDCPPDLLLSGINQGMNVADDITCSGTVGAAWEATVYGIPSIALSQKTAPHTQAGDAGIFSTARRHAQAVISELWSQSWAEGTLMNVNFPNLGGDDEPKGVKMTYVGRHKKADVILKGELQDKYSIGMWKLRDKLYTGSDVEAVMADYITVCPLQLDMTAYDHFERS